MHGIASMRATLFTPPPVQRLPRGVDKKKVAKLAAKLRVLGASAKQPDVLVPLCGVNGMTVVFSVTPANLSLANAAIKRVSEGGEVFVRVGGGLLRWLFFFVCSVLLTFDLSLSPLLSSSLFSFPWCFRPHSHLATDQCTF